MLELNKLKDNKQLREHIIGPEKIGQEVLARWNYLFYSDYINIKELSKEISEAIQHWYNLGKYILPKSQDKVIEMIEMGQLVAIMGRDTSGKMRFITACMYSILGKDINGTEVIEVGGLLANPSITTKRDDPDLILDEDNQSKQTLVFPINNFGLSNKNHPTYGSQVVNSVIELIKIKHPEATIIATARGYPSEKALVHSGLEVTKWTPELKKLSCDPGCKGLVNGIHTNCSFADKDFITVNDGKSGCHLLVLPQGS